MSNKVTSKFIHLSELAIKVNTYTKHTVFINFSGHVNLMEMYYNKDGYRDGENNRIVLFEIFANHTSEKDILKVFEDAEKKLIDLMKKESL